MGVVELPVQQWPELIPALQQHATAAEVTDATKQATLECIGYMCEDLPEDAIRQEETNALLTAIINGMRPEQAANIRLAACTALANSLEFCQKNFDRQEERDVIMQMIEAGASAPEVEIRVGAMKCLVKVAECYYKHLTAYMQRLFTLTFERTKHDEEDVGLQAIEFWNTICETEGELIEDLEEAQENGEVPEQQCQYYTRGAAIPLCQLLTECLSKQEEDQDENSWNLSMASALCIGAAARTAGDEVVNQVMPFVLANIQNPSWNLREGAVMAFGCIMEGASEETLAPLVVQSVLMLANMMCTDPVVLVKDTAAWAVGQICDHHAKSIPTEQLPQVVTKLLEAMEMEARVAANCCYAIHNLAQSFEEDERETNEMSACFTPAVQKLLAVSERADWRDAELRLAAYEAINMLIQAAAPDCKAAIVHILPVIVQRLEASFAMPLNTAEEKEDVFNLQPLLCSTIQVSVQVLEEIEAAMATQIMQSLLRVFAAPHAVSHEESFMAIGAVANATGAQFQIYMAALKPFLVQGLKTFEEYNVCAVAVRFCFWLSLLEEASGLFVWVVLLPSVVADECLFSSLLFSSLCSLLSALFSAPRSSLLPLSPFPPGRHLRRHQSRPGTGGQGVLRRDRDVPAPAAAAPAAQQIGQAGRD
jgi:importin subunit beta-1